MARKLVWGTLGGAVLGAAFGHLGGNIAIGIAGAHAWWGAGMSTR